VPGGPFNFTVVVTNTGTNAVSIESLIDDIYGDVATRPGSTCGQRIGTVLQPGQSSVPCTFTVTYSADHPASQTDVVLATAVDPFDRHPQASDDATITLTRRTPTISTEASPTVLLGGSVTDVAELQGATNPSGTVTYRLYGPDDPTCSRAPAFTTVQSMSPLGRVSSNPVVPTASGTYRWIASYSGDVNNAPVAGDCNDPHEQVEVRPVPPPAALPTISVQKDAVPSTRPAPGGPFTFRVRVTNTSSRVLTLVSLDDTVYGDLDGLGSCSVPQQLDPGHTYQCEFTGVFVGGSGDTETDVVEARAIDPEGRPARDSDDETITLTGQLRIGVTKTASPSSRPAPGGSFTFTVVTANLSNVPVTITKATDDVYGNIGGNGKCPTLVGTRLLPGATVTCTFDGPFTGQAGQAQRDVVVVTAVDDLGHPTEAMDDAVVTLTAPAPGPTIPPVTVLPVTIPKTGANTSGMLATGMAVGSFGLLFVGLADERSRRVEASRR
jgi:hypothetical protein